MKIWMYGGKLAQVMLPWTDVLCLLTSQDMPVINSDSKNDDNKLLEKWVWSINNFSYGGVISPNAS